MTVQKFQRLKLPGTDEVLPCDTVQSGQNLPKFWRNVITLHFRVAVNARLRQRDPLMHQHLSSRLTSVTFQNTS